ncbi:hypothetical protein Tco_0314089 [Tanacetum coccineum]
MSPGIPKGEKKLKHTLAVDLASCRLGYGLGLITARSLLGCCKLVSMVDDEGRSRLGHLNSGSWLDGSGGGVYQYNIEVQTDDSRYVRVYIRVQRMSRYVRSYTLEVSTIADHCVRISKFEFCKFENRLYCDQSVRLQLLIISRIMVNLVRNGDDEGRFEVRPPEYGSMFDMLGLYIRGLNDESNM